MDLKLLAIFLFAVIISPAMAELSKTQKDELNTAWDEMMIAKGQIEMLESSSSISQEQIDGVRSKTETIVAKFSDNNYRNAATSREKEQLDLNLGIAQDLKSRADALTVKTEPVVSAPQEQQEQIVPAIPEQTQTEWTWEQIQQNTVPKEQECHREYIREHPKECDCQPTFFQPEIAYVGRISDPSHLFAPDNQYQGGQFV